MWLAQQWLSLEAPTAQTPYAMVDGTGVGYATPFYAQFRRGAEIRRLRSHVKAVVMGYWQGGRVWVMGAALGQTCVSASIQKGIPPLPPRGSRGQGG